MSFVFRWIGYVWRRWGDYQSAQALWDLIDAKTRLLALAGVVGMSFLGASNTSWSAPGVVLASLIAGACIALIIIGAKIVVSRPKTRDPVDRGTQAPSQTQIRDVGLGEAVAFLGLKVWGKRFIEAAGASDVDAASIYDAVLQAAADGLIPIWGKRTQQSVFEPIPREYWFDHRFDWFSLLRNDANSESSKYAFSGDRYLSLMTSRSAVEVLL